MEGLDTKVVLYAGVKRRILPPGGIRTTVFEPIKVTTDMIMIKIVIKCKVKVKLALCFITYNALKTSVAYLSTTP
jgi:hypothetical protein